MQITEYLEWFRERAIPVYVHGKGYALSREPAACTTLIEHHRVIVDGVIVYCGDDRHAACIVLLDYANDDRPTNVQYQMLRQVVPVGTDQETLSWTWAIDGADHAHAPQEEEQ